MSQGATVCVTGASGYIASVLVSLLLEKGYNVHGTVRSLADQSRVNHFKTIGDGKPGKLTLFEADLLRKGSFDQAIQGCQYVIHMACPFMFIVNDPVKDLLEPALHGTKNVFSSIVKHKATIKRVVLTSSIVAINAAGSVPKTGDLFTEEDWNRVSTINNGTYFYSKRIAEEVAWRIANNNGINMVALNPALVLGPPIWARSDSTSIRMIKNILEGTKRFLRTCVVDVRDVALAHILAIENPKAQGRYILGTRRPVQPSFVAQTLKDAFPALPIDVAEHKKHDYPQNPPDEVYDTSKAEKELGIKLRPVEDSLIDMAKALLVDFKMSKL